MHKFMPKSRDLRIYNLPGGQTDAEVFVKRNINIPSIYEAILYLFQFQNKNDRYPVCLSLRMRGNRSRGEEFARLSTIYHCNVLKDIEFIYGNNCVRLVISLICSGGLLKVLNQNSILFIIAYLINSD